MAVLEARDRIGGRVHTHRIAGGAHAEAGGEFIDTRHTTMLAYCKRFGLELEDTRRGGRGLRGVVWRNGSRHAGPEFRTPPVMRKIDGMYRRIYEFALQVDPSDPLAGGGRRLDRTSVAALLDRARLGNRARFLAERSIRDDYGAEPRSLSLLGLLLSERIEYDQPPDGVEAFRVAAGNSTLPEALAASLSTPPALASPVLGVRHGAGGVAVRTGGGEWAADACVLAVPVPALRRIEIDPAPRGALAEAVATLRNVPVVKTLLPYRKRFWRRRDESGGLASDLELGTTWEGTDGQRTSEGILIAYASGSRGVAVARRAPERRITRARRDVARVWPGTSHLALLGEAATFAWATDPWAGGAWSGYAPGQVESCWVPLKEADPAVGPRLVLAGEHTDRLNGYMEGAARSGKRAARLVANAASGAT